MSKLTKTTKANNTLAIHVAPGIQFSGARALRAAWLAVLELYDLAPRRVSLAIIGDAEMSQLHFNYSSIAGTTDVLAFDLRGGAGEFEGEIAICIDVARREAKKRKLTFIREMQLYLIHGMLHLCGFDDHNPPDRARMRRAERKVFQFLEK